MPLHICHLSILNPALHSRIFHKEALSMVAAGHKVSIIAQDPSPQPYDLQGVRIIPMAPFSRLSWQRFRAPARIRSLAQRVQADVFFIHTPELLGMAQRLKQAFPAARFVYDMHEDYALNIRTAGYYPLILKGFLARRVQAAERRFAEWGDAVVYAEDSFAGLVEMQKGQSIFVRNRFRMPENAPIPSMPGNDAMPLMLFSGTVAENWGIMRAVELWKELNRFLPLQLKVAGVVYDAALKRKIHEAVATSGLPDRFTWLGDGNYLPHYEILNAIATCSLGVAPYVLRPNILDRIPTRFHEYMAFGKPMVFTRNPAWDQLNKAASFGMGLQWPLQAVEVADLAARIQAGWQTKVDASHWAWEGEERRLLDLLSTF